jgi:hypothetical protein
VLGFHWQHEACFFCAKLLSVLFQTP